MILQRFAPIKDENDIKVACERMSALHKKWLVDYSKLQFDETKVISFDNFYFDNLGEP